MFRNVMSRISFVYVARHGVESDIISNFLKFGINPTWEKRLFLYNFGTRYVMVTPFMEKRSLRSSEDSSTL